MLHFFTLINFLIIFFLLKTSCRLVRICWTVTCRQSTLEFYPSWCSLRGGVCGGRLLIYLLYICKEKKIIKMLFAALSECLGKTNVINTARTLIFTSTDILLHTFFLLYLLFFSFLLFHSFNLPYEHRELRVLSLDVICSHKLITKRVCVNLFAKRNLFFIHIFTCSMHHTRKDIRFACETFFMTDIHTSFH
jgi:hypothetical protein